MICEDQTTMLYFNLLQKKIKINVHAKIELMQFI
jgi:hypothetical protein